MAAKPSPRNSSSSHSGTNSPSATSAAASVSHSPPCGVRSGVRPWLRSPCSNGSSAIPTTAITTTAATTIRAAVPISWGRTRASARRRSVCDRRAASSA
jgi:hypothetical protein